MRSVGSLEFFEFFLSFFLSFLLWSIKPEKIKYKNKLQTLGSASDHLVTIGAARSGRWPIYALLSFLILFLSFLGSLSFLLEFLGSLSFVVEFFMQLAKILWNDKTSNYTPSKESMSETITTSNAGQTNVTKHRLGALCLGIWCPVRTINHMSYTTRVPLGQN